MTASRPSPPALRHPDSFFIAGSWVSPSTSSTVEVFDSNTEQVFLTVARAAATDMDRAVEAARSAFDAGPWPRMSHVERAVYLDRMSSGLQAKADVLADAWPRESGVVARIAASSADDGASILRYYAGLADTFDWETEASPSTGAKFGMKVREPVGVVGAIVPWNAPLPLALYKLAPALLAGCTVVLKASPEAPTALYALAEVASEVGLPSGVVNLVTADRDVSELLVTDHRVDKIAFTGSTAAGRRIASLMGERIGRYTLELGGKSPALILDDADLDTAAASIAEAECVLSGQVCSSLTRLIVSRARHDEFTEALAAHFSRKVVGDAFADETEIGPLATSHQRARVESFIREASTGGARLVTGGDRPAHLGTGYFVEPTVFANVDNGSRLAKEEIFGPVLSVIPATDEEDIVRLANDSIYGLNASVFTQDVDRARHVAGRLRSGTVAHNAMRNDFGIAFGGFKQSGVGREGGIEGLMPYLETKTVLLDGPPVGYRDDRQI